MPADGLGQRLEQLRRAADPVGQGGAVEIDALPPEDLALAIQREVVAVLRDQHMGEQTRPWPAALDRARGQRRLAECLAARAGHARAHDPGHDEAAGDVVELLGDVLSDPLQCAAALAAGVPGGEHLLVARQAVGERLALRPLLRPGCLTARGGVLRGRDADLGLFEGKLELLQGLGLGAEPVTAMAGQRVLQLLDLERLGLHQLDQVGRGRAELGRVFGQRCGVLHHARTYTRPARVRESPVATSC